MEANRQNWDAEDYARNSSAQLEWATELMVKLALKGDEALLDIGCGDGKIMAELSRHLPPVLPPLLRIVATFGCLARPSRQV